MAPGRDCSCSHILLHAAIERRTDDVAGATKAESLKEPMLVGSCAGGCRVFAAMPSAKGDKACIVKHKLSTRTLSSTSRSSRP